jgi:hypothetical protein
MINQKGITLISLAAIIIVIMIITSVTIYTGFDVIDKSRLTRFNAEMRIIHAKVNEIADQKLSQEELENLGQLISTLNSTLQTKIMNALEGQSAVGFIYFNKTNLRNIGIDNIDRDVIINFTTREVVSLNGVKKDGTTIYRAEYLYNVDYENANTQAPTYNIQKKMYGINAKIILTDIEYKGNVGKGTVSYTQLNGLQELGWNTVQGEEINITKSGRYKIRLTDSAGNITDKTVEVTLANSPKLSAGMTPVVYDSQIGKWKKVDENSGDWYDYSSDKKQWANVMLQDGLTVNPDGTIDNNKMGSMFVWIPRYMYNIKSGYHTSTAGEIDVKFLKGTSNIPTDDINVTISTISGQDKWLVHPAFQDGSLNGFANGEWDKEITGIWIAKFEASRSDATIGSVGTSNIIKIQPNVRNWRSSLSIGNMYLKSLEMMPSLESHLIKRSEWGAVAYLTHSKYGRNGIEISVNDNSNYLTGGGDYQTNVNQGTTGNIYGIYDMSGGTYEYMASYVATGNANLNTNGGSFASTAENPKSTKYVTVYKKGTTDSMANNYAANSDKYGDAVWEVSNGSTSWFSDSVTFPYGSIPFFVSGGNYDSGSGAGVFYLALTDGASFGSAFRPTIVI